MELILGVELLTRAINMKYKTLMQVKEVIIRLKKNQRDTKIFSCGQINNLVHP